MLLVCLWFQPRTPAGVGDGVRLAVQREKAHNFHAELAPQQYSLNGAWSGAFTLHPPHLLGKEKDIKTSGSTTPKGPESTILFDKHFLLRQLQSQVYISVCLVIM